MAYTRHRERDTRTGIDLIADDVLCNGNAGTHYTGNSLTSYGVGNGVFQATDDVEIPNFHARSARGEIFNNPFYSYKVTLTCGYPNFWEWVRNANCTGTTVKSSHGHSPRSGWGGWLAPDVNYTFGVQQSLRELAGTQAWSNVSGPEVLGGEFIHDLDKTWHMLRHPLEGFHKTLEKVRKSKSFLKQNLSLGAFVADEWLKYRYGMTPLVNDLMNGFHAAIVPQYSERQTARGSASAPEWSDDDSVVLTPDSHWTDTTVRHVETQCYARAGVLYVHVASMGGKFGLSAHNILPTLWEFIPYSFVADWFINAGDFLAAVTPKAQVKVLASWTTSKTRVYRESTETSVVGPIVGYTHNGGPGWTASKEELETLRQPYAVKALTFRLNDLTLSKSKNWMHFADGMALAGQYLLHRPRTPWEPRPAGRKIRPKEWTQQEYNF